MQDSQIQAFLAIAETNSITKAAELLKIKPPSVSERITRLEQALGKVLSPNNAGEDTSVRNIKLFRNAGRRVELTEHGYIFLPFARIIEENWLRAKINIDKK